MWKIISPKASIEISFAERFEKTDQIPQTFVYQTFPAEAIGQESGVYYAKRGG